MGDLLEERQQEMAEILTKENGKPLAEAKVCFQMFSNFTKRVSTVAVLPTPYRTFRSV